MPSLINLVLSLTAIIISSLVYSDGFDVRTGDVAQPLRRETAVADTPDGLGNPTFGFDVTSEAEDWTKIADNSNRGSEQAVVAEPDNHRCFNTNKIRREIGKSCPFNGAPLELRHFSAQERKPSSRGQSRKTRPRKNEATPGSSETPQSTRDLNCPPGSWAVCGANEPMHDFLNPGIFREVPWLLENIPQIIELQNFCRYWYPQNQCDTTEGRELPMCCERVELRSSEFPIETLSPFARAYTLQYPYLGFFCEPLAS